MRIIIRFKSGFELPITCDSFKFSTHSMTGEIAEYTINGIKDNKPIFFRSEDVECVFQDMTAYGEGNKDDDKEKQFAQMMASIADIGIEQILPHEVCEVICVKCGKR